MCLTRQYPVVPSAWYRGSTSSSRSGVPASTLAAHRREARSAAARAQRNASVRCALFQVAMLQSDDQRALRVRTQLKGLHFEALGADVHKVYSISRVPMLRTPREWAALKWWPFGTADVEKVRVRVDPSASPHPLPAFSTGDCREIAPPSHLQRMLMWSADPIHASLTHLQPADEKVPEAARARARRGSATRSPCAPTSHGSGRSGIVPQHPWVYGRLPALVPRAPCARSDSRVLPLVRDRRRGTRHKCAPRHAAHRCAIGRLQVILMLMKQLTDNPEPESRERGQRLLNM